MVKELQGIQDEQSGWYNTRIPTFTFLPRRFLFISLIAYNIMISFASLFTLNGNVTIIQWDDLAMNMCAFSMNSVHTKKTSYKMRAFVRVTCYIKFSRTKFPTTAWGMINIAWMLNEEYTLNDG